MATLTLTCMPQHSIHPHSPLIIFPATRARARGARCPSAKLSTATCTAGRDRTATGARARIICMKRLRPRRALTGARIFLPSNTAPVGSELGRLLMSPPLPAPFGCAWVTNNKNIEKNFQEHHAPLNSLAITIASILLLPLP